MLFIQIQHLNTQEVESEYIERTQFHLESAIGLLQLLIINIGQTQDRILQDFKIILETVLGQLRVILETFFVLERQDSERTASSWAKIARILGISESTLRRQRELLLCTHDNDDHYLTRLLFVYRCNITDA